MVTGIVLFLLLLNVGIFLTPYFIRRFTENEAGDYVVRRLIIMAGFVVLWFNTLIFRILAESYNLGIDDQLIAYWWMFTMVMFIVIFGMTFVMTKGALKLAQEAKMRRRMGDAT